MNKLHLKLKMNQTDMNQTCTAERRESREWNNSGAGHWMSSDVSASQKSFTGTVNKRSKSGEFPSLGNETWRTQNFKISLKFETNSRHCSCLKNTRTNKSTHVFLSNINKSSWTRNGGIVFTDYKLLLMEKSVSVPPERNFIWCIT